MFTVLKGLPRPCRGEVPHQRVGGLGAPCGPWGGFLQYYKHGAWSTFVPNPNLVTLSTTRSESWFDDDGALS